MRAAFQSVSQDLEEAAALDGDPPGPRFTRSPPLALPPFRCSPGGFLAGYSEFAIGWLFIEKSSNVTLAMALWGPEPWITPWSNCLPGLLISNPGN